MTSLYANISCYVANATRVELGSAQGMWRGFLHLSPRPSSFDGKPVMGVEASDLGEDIADTPGGGG